MLGIIQSKADDILKRHRNGRQDLYISADAKPSVFFTALFRVRILCVGLSHLKCLRCIPEDFHLFRKKSRDQSVHVRVGDPGLRNGQHPCPIPGKDSDFLPEKAEQTASGFLFAHRRADSKKGHDRCRFIECAVVIQSLKCHKSHNSYLQLLRPDTSLLPLLYGPFSRRA